MSAKRGSIKSLKNALYILENRSFSFIFLQNTIPEKSGGQWAETIERLGAQNSQATLTSAHSQLRSSNRGLSLVPAYEYDLIMSTQHKQRGNEWNYVRKVLLICDCNNRLPEQCWWYIIKREKKDLHQIFIAKFPQMIHQHRQLLTFFCTDQTT